MDNFYITLPSNVVGEKYNNTIANYTTKLAGPVNLEGNWEVGLASISYTKSWYNLSKLEYIKLWYFDELPRYYYITVDSLTGQYEEMEILIETLNNLMKEATYKISLKSRSTINTDELPPPESLPAPQALSAQRKFVIEELKRIQKLYNDNMEAVRRERQEALDQERRNKIKALITYPPEFRIDSKINKVFCKFGMYKNAVIYPEFSKNLANMLGFNQNNIDDLKKNKYDHYNSFNDVLNFPNSEEEEYRADYPCDLSGGIHTLYIYCDIVKHSFVGDSYTQLIRYVEIPPQYSFGEQVALTYPDTHYIPVLNKEFQTIEIDIKDDTGNTMSFEFGRSIVVLHFRKKL